MICLGAADWLLIGISSPEELYQATKEVAKALTRKCNLDFPEFAITLYFDGYLPPYEKVCELVKRALEVVKGKKLKIELIYMKVFGKKDIELNFEFEAPKSAEETCKEIKNFVITSRKVVKSLL